MTKFESFDSLELNSIKDVFNQLSYLQLDVINLAYIVESYIYFVEKEYHFGNDNKLKAEYKTKFGLKDGYYKEWHAFNWNTGEYDKECYLTRCTYSNGNRIGKYVEWWNNGEKAKECFYSEDGKLEGTFKSWYRNGNKWLEIVYSNYPTNGEYKEWDQYGQLTKHFINNKNNKD